MATYLFTHQACIDHDPGSTHPEKPDRLRAVLAALDGDDFAALERRDAPVIGIEEVKRVHDSGYVDSVLASVPERGRVHLDPDTVLSPASVEAALRAAGAAAAAVDAVAGGGNAFCAVRPPGHHAEPGRAMGFCLFNSVAVAALHARAEQGLRRVAVVDFDVHHGNGTQAAFERDGDLFYASSHQSPFYPGTGHEDDCGVGNIVNVELAAGSGGDEFRRGWSRLILPALREFDPDLLLISAGFDAHVMDPLAQIGLATEDFTWVTRELLDVADECCQGRMVSCLEGGYDLVALGECARAHVGALMER